jgi:AcrR family transcriptional regulator
MKKKQYRLEQIYEAALGVFARGGYKKTTMADLATQMGMSQGNMYLYVKNKRDLYEKSVIHALYKFEKFMVEALQTEEDAVRQIIAMSEAGFMYISENEDLRAIIVNDEGLLLRPLEEIFSSENVENYAEDYEFSKNILEKCLRQGIRENHFRQFNTAYISELLTQIYIMFIKQILIMPDQISKKEMTKEIVNLVLYGIVDDREKEVKKIAYKGYGDR